STTCATHDTSAVGRRSRRARRDHACSPQGEASQIVEWGTDGRRRGVSEPRCGHGAPYPGRPAGLLRQGCDECWAYLQTELGLSRLRVMTLAAALREFFDAEKDAMSYPQCEA